MQTPLNSRYHAYHVVNAIREIEIEIEKFNKTLYFRYFYFVNLDGFRGKRKTDRGLKYFEASVPSYIGQFHLCR